MIAKKFPKFVLILLLIFGWIFSGWPPIWNSPPFPPKPETAYAAVGYDQTATGNNGTGNTSVTATISTAGTDRVLLATVSYNPGVASANDAAVTGGSGGLTWSRVTGNSSAGSTVSVEVWVAVSSTTQSSQVITASFSTTRRATLVVSSYTGVSPYNPTGATCVANGTTNAANGVMCSLTTLYDNSLVTGHAAVRQNPSLTAGTNYTLNGTNVTTNGTASNNVRGGQVRRNSLVSPPANTAVYMTQSINNNRWAMAGVELKPQPTFDQSAYRWFANADSYDVGAALTASQDQVATLGATGIPFRLRLLMHVGISDLPQNGLQFKLQFVGKGTGTCASPSGGTPSSYTDVTTATAISFFNNSGPPDKNDGNALTENASDPTHPPDTIVPETYEELNNFTNSAAAVPPGQDGKWDFALYDNGAPSNTTYCFQAVISDDTPLDTYASRPELTTAPVPLYAQNYFRFYDDNDALIPTDPWPPGAADLGENAGITIADNPLAVGEHLRLRLSLQVSATATPATTQAFRLQYGTLVTTCGAIGSWNDIGAPGSGSIWRGFAATPADGTALSGDPPAAGDLKLSVSDRAGTYEESNDTASNPFGIAVGEDAEYDWNVENNGATGATNYCFRMAKGAGGAALESHNFYPTIRTAGFRPKSQNWRWYDDETNETPATALAAENIAPADIENDNIIKLRLTAKETANVAGTNAKLKLQFSQSSDFSSGIFTVDATSTCSGSSSWCYADGAGTDNVKITTKTLSDADACAASAGNGCGTHNEASSTASTFAHAALAAAEYEFTIMRSGASPNTVYYFRPYDVVNDVPVPLNTGESYPSLTTKGGLLSFTVDGVSSGTATEGVTTDITTTATSIPFGTLSFGAEVEGAQRLTVTTDADYGYQVFLRQESGFLSNNGAEILGVTGTNASPSAWATGCPSSAAGCYGYHAGDDTLAGGSTAGTYDSTLMYIVVPVF
ncbi:MAG: hypothetical protein HYT94_02520 [Parcubacteria group bacterium]|nr:hypothetical protein [Parcubacteria group bacterium]